MSPNTQQSSQDDLLIVDDDLPSLRALSHLLAEHGYLVRSARDGASALMMADAEPPDLILLDIQMPGLDGYQVCRALKERTATSNVPVLFISAGDDVLDKVKSFEIGGVDYITKPFREQEVLARVQTHLTLSKLNAQLRNSNAELEVEIRERKQIEAHLQRRLEEFSSLHEISKTLAVRLTLPQALEAISEKINELFKARLTLIARLSADGLATETLVGHDQSRGLIAYSGVQSRLQDWPVALQTMAENRARVLEKLELTTLSEPIRAFVHAGHLTTGLLIPLISRNIVWALLLIAKEGKWASFSPFEVILAETVAADIAAAIENERLTHQAREAAVNAERQRLARELHDSVTQSIYSLTLLSSGWESMSRQGTLENPADSFRRLGEIGQQTLREMRLLIHQLRPSVLAEQGLVKALQQRLENVELRANIDARLIVEGAVIDLPHKVEDEIYFIAQEALNNSLRHARADSIQVRLKLALHEIALTVEDDGCGFDPEDQLAGMGLGNMQERAQSVAGKLTLHSYPGRGTQISVSVPIPPEVRPA